MMAIRFEPNERRLATLYDRPSPGFRLTRKTLLACGAVGLLYAGFGLAVMSYRITHEVAIISEPPAIRITQDVPTKPEVPLRQKPVLTTPPKFHDPVLKPDMSTGDTLPRPADGDTAPIFGPATTLDDPGSGITLPPPHGPLMIKNPEWVSKPTAAQLGRIYPERAANKEMSGGATLLCGVATDGSMVGCAVIDESPKGWRFGEAALAAARYFKMSPRTVDGQIVGGAKVRIPIVFNLG